MRSQLVGEDSVVWSSRAPSCTLCSTPSTPFLFFYSLSSLVSFCTVSYHSSVLTAYPSSVSSTDFISWWNPGKTDTQRHWMPYPCHASLVAELRTEHRAPHVRSLLYPFISLELEAQRSCFHTQLQGSCYASQRKDWHDISVVMEAIWKRPFFNSLFTSLTQVVFHWYVLKQ